MKLKIYYLIIFFLNLFLFQAQKSKYIIFQPNFEAGKDYYLEVTTNEHLIDRKGKVKHPSIDYVKFRIKKDQTFNNETHYIFEVLDKNHRHLDREEIPVENYFKNIIMRFKTTEEGRYLGITNLDNIKNQIKKALSDEKIKELTKSSSDDYAVLNLKMWRNEPIESIAYLEHHIISYFRYYGLKIKYGKETYRLRIERFPFLKSEPLPYQSNFELIEKDDHHILVTNFVVDKNKISKEEYIKLAKCCAKSLEKFKENYHNEFQETIKFLNSTGFANEYNINIQVSTASGDGGKWILEKKYKLTQ